MAVADLNTEPIRFALYARTSTDDQQDPVSSLGWQRLRVEQMVAGYGEVVAVFHDVGQSRSIPWSRRPEATAMLEEAERPNRRFDAIAVAEAARAFSGGQYGFVAPVLADLGVDLWCPDMAGRIDPESDAHDMMMTLHGGLSRTERRKIQMRVKTAMKAQCAAGPEIDRGGRYWLGARPPFGYRLVRTNEPHPKPDEARRGVTLSRLEVDPDTAAVVRRIFHEWVVLGRGVKAIADGLVADGIAPPKSAWSVSSIRRIVANPHYLGRAVRFRREGYERLIDRSNATLGSEKKYRRNPVDEWVWSAEATHEAIIDPDLWARAQPASVTPDVSGRRHRRATADARSYPLRGVVWCAWCGKAMTGITNDGTAYYRCWPGPLARQQPGMDDHPRAFTIQQRHLGDALDRVIAGLFTDPTFAEATIADMAAASAARTSNDPAAERARHRLTAAKAEVQRCHDALAKGADPTFIAEHSRQAMAAVRSAEAEAAAYEVPAAEPLDAGALRVMVAEVAPTISKRLAKLAADPVARREFYVGLGLRVDVDHRPVDRIAVTVTVPVSPALTGPKRAHARV